MSTPAAPITSVVSATPPAAAPPVAAAPPAGPTAAEVEALKAELATSKAAAAENERTAKFWHGKATAAPEKPAAAAPPEDETDVLDVITSKGEKGLDALLKKRGFVTKAELDSTVDAKANQIVSEGQLLKEYPELDNKDSDFFKATAQFYGELKRDGVPERVAMRIAAKEAKLAGIESGTIKTATQKTADEKAAAAEERRARAAAGAGDHGGRGSAEEADDTPTEDEQRAIQRLADALEIPLDKATERYKARAKKGVQVAVKLQR